MARRRTQSQRREDDSAGAFLGLSVGVAGLAIGGGAYLFWDRFLRDRDGGPGTPDPEWEVGDRVIFLNRDINTLQRNGEIVSRRFDGEWLYNIEEDGGLDHTNIPESDIIGPAGPPGVAGGAAIWLFNEGSGTTAFDSTPSNHDLFLVNTIWTSEGLRFPSPGSSARCPNFRPEDNFTIGAEVTFDTLMPTGAGRDPRICQSGQIASDISYSLSCETLGNRRQIHFTVYVGKVSGEVYSQTIIQPGTQYYIVAVKHGPSLRLYINGELDNTSSCPAGQVDVVAGNFNVGDSPGNSDGQFIGTIGELRIYNRVLNDAEIDILSG
jgi:hypothetical protein